MCRQAGLRPDSDQADPEAAKPRIRLSCRQARENAATDPWRRTWLLFDVGPGPLGRAFV
jgi:hypothetical protein